MRFIVFGASACVLALLAPAVAAQLADLQPGRNFTAQPNFGAHRSWQLDGGDVDADGDIDVAVANGGVGAPQLSRLYINSGAGHFTDETATRFAGFPTMNARDIDFFDVESDGDLDVFIAALTLGASSSGAVSRFFVNLGGAQRGSVGFFEERTDDFWGALVSVPASQQVFGGNSGPFRE
ncbi:MAG TPA: FG-GAP-like repeat-containing protein, partial [Planctomycetota bacterium]|nr:FG-GAP-like repeat-containing protein [Planctomycetota bacterium]